MKTLRQDTQRTRKSLLEAAIEVFAEKGYANTTVAEISERAGANIAAINYHFGSKETLYREAWRGAIDNSLSAYPTDGGVSSEASPEERLKGQIISCLRRINDDDNKEFLITYKELANPTGILEEVMAEYVIPLRQGMEGLVRELMGSKASGEAVRFSTIGIIGQCIIPALLTRPRKGKAMDIDWWEIKDVETYAEHIIATSLAGMAAIGEQADGGVPTE